MSEPVSYEVRDRVAHVTVDNGKANVFSPAVVDALDDCCARAESAGDEVGAMLLTGRPGMLSGGFDLEVMRSSAEAAGRLVTAGGALITRLYGAPVPVVVACSGHAVAAGALLLLGADVRIGARGAFRIGLIETQIGMVLPRWAVELAQERLSPRHLQRAAVGARMYGPDEAADAGFLDLVVEPDELDRTAAAEAVAWSELPRHAYAGQVAMNRGERLSRLRAAVEADRGRSFEAG